MDIASGLDLFIDIVAQGSFSKAAACRNMDRAVVTKQFKALENLLDVRLLNRTTRSIALTDAGREVLKQAYIIRDQITHTQKLAESFGSEPKGGLRVSSSVRFGLLYIQPAINAFLKKYPQVNIELILNDKLVNIVDEKLDISFRIGPPRDSSNIAFKLGSMNLVVLASKSFIEQYGEPSSVEELANLPAVVYSSDSFVFDNVELISKETGEKVKHKLTGNFKSNNVQSLLSAVTAGIGYCVTDLSALENNLEDLGLVQLLKSYTFSNEFGDIYAVYPHRNQTPMVKEFIAIVKQTVGSPAKWESFLEEKKVSV